MIFFPCTLLHYLCMQKALNDRENNIFASIIIILYTCYLQYILYKA